MKSNSRIFSPLQRLKVLAEGAAQQYDCCSKYGEYAEAFLENGLFLERLRLFPEVEAESPYGRLAEDGDNAWIDRPKKRPPLGF